MHRLAIRLRGHMVMLEPPQHVATLGIAHDRDGRFFELMPATAEEMDGGEAVLQRLPQPAPSAAASEVGSGIAARYLDRFPQVSEIDLAHLPEHYKRSLASNVAYFDFVPGERYVVSLVSELTLQTVVVAE